MSDSKMNPLDPQLDKELNTKALAGSAMGLLLLVAVAAGLMWLLSGFLRDWETSQDPAPPALTAERESYEPPAPRLQEEPFGDIREMRMAEEAVLESYGWVDEAAGIAQVPIERAIEIAAARGLTLAADTPAVGDATAEEGPE